MSVRMVFVMLIALGLLYSCLPASTPSPAPSPTARPSATLVLSVPTNLLPTATNDRHAPDNVPACKGARYLEQPLTFVWPGMDDIVRDAPEANWTYYHCAQPPAALAASYRQWMIKAPYAWLETYWEEQPDATLGVYFHKDPDQWLYLWFLPEADDPQASALVAAWWDRPHSC